MRLTPSTARSFSRQSELTIEPQKLKELLVGFEIEDDPVKVRYSWAFRLDGIDCAVWEYMGSWRRHEFHLWSAGPMVALKDFLLSRPEPMPAVFRSYPRQPKTSKDVEVACRRLATLIDQENKT